MNETAKDTAKGQAPESDIQAVETLTSEAYEAISDLVHAQDRAALLADLDARHEADIAEIITVLATDLRTSLLQLVGDALEPEVFAELDDAVRDDVLEVVDTDTVVNTVQRLDSDDAVFVLEDMDDDERQEVLDQIPQTDRLVLERALDFPEESAGRLMQSAFISVPPYWSVGQTIDYLRDTEDLPDDFLEIYIIDPTYTPIGVVHLAEMLRAQRVRPMEELQHDDFYII